MRGLSVLGLLTLVSSVAQAACPGLEWMDHPDIPACPKSNNTILSENYPTMAYVVPDFEPDFNDSVGSKKLVLKILDSLPDRTPLVLLPGDESYFLEMKDQIEEKFENDPVKKKKFLDALVWVDVEDYPWQQDYFESFRDLKTGRPVIRQIADYKEGKARDIFKALNDRCEEVSQGKILSTRPMSDNIMGSMGGNIEGLPGGLCFHGDTQSWDTYTKDYCGDRENEVVVSTSWLDIGHVDEVIKVLPNPSLKAPCDFAIAITSPKKAIELLRKNDNEKFRTFFSNENLSKSQIEDEMEIRSGDEGISALCLALEEQKKEIYEPNENPKHSPGGMLNLFLPDAFARSPQKQAAIDCMKRKNVDVARLLESEEPLGVLNRLVQIEMDHAKDSILDKLKARLPQCKVEFIDVPGLFFRGEPVELSGGEGKRISISEKYALPKEMLRSLNPNSINSLNIGKKAIVPHPLNRTFAEYIENSYKKLGLEVDFFDTWLMNKRLGNLHCTTHAIPICRPSGEKNDR